MSERLCMTVNGEACTATVTPRTQLAEVLRDHLDLTGTHLACEQGVCGACTVMMNGMPVRACITFANSCDGAVIETIEGHAGDPVMERLRTAFSRHHALQCGFCTPGMLATARDIVARFDRPDEATIRHELSGNLCRCTGYVGIVRAIEDVIGQCRAEGIAPERASPPLPARAAAFAPFSPVAARAAPMPATSPAQGSLTIDGGTTIVRRSFALSHSSAQVWALFRDPRAVAACLPGASIDSLAGDQFEGAVEIRFGPIRARFGGKGTVANDDKATAGRIEGRGDDRTGKSKVRGELTYHIADGDSPGTSRADVELHYQLEGMLAQFNRPELVSGFVDFLLGQFVANCDARLSGQAMPVAGKLSFWVLLRVIARSFFARK